MSSEVINIQFWLISGVIIGNTDAKDDLNL